MKRALIISAHPDDDILGCGGILSKYKNKVSFKVVFIGEGSTCRFSSANSAEAQKEVKIRNSYAKKAFGVLGVDEYSFYNLPCGRFDTVSLIEINKIIEKEISDFKPDTVFTHSESDSNKDHVKVHDATIIATRPDCGVEGVYTYEVLSSTEWGFNQAFSPNIFFSLSEKNVNEKYEALDKYVSEVKPFPHPRSKKGIFTLATQRGMQSGNSYAEAFKLIRHIYK